MKFHLISTLWIVILYQLQNGNAAVSLRLGVLVATNPDKTEEKLYCIGYYPKAYNFTNTREQMTLYPLSSVTYLNRDIDSCQPDLGDQDVSGKFVFVDAEKRAKNETQCTILDRAANVQAKDGIGILLNSTLAVRRFNRTEDTETTIPIAAVIQDKTMARLMKLKEEHPDWVFGIYTPDDYGFDMSSIVTLLMAVTTVALGSLWSGYVKHHLRLKHQEDSERRHVCDHAGNEETASAGASNSESRRGSRFGSRRDDEQHICEHAASGQSTEDISLRVSPGYVMFYVVLMCSMLVLLYYFIDYLVYFIIGMFCLTSIIAVYSCFEPFVMWTYECMPSCPTFRLPRCNFYLCILNMELRQFLLLAASVAISVVWLVYRNTDWAWVLQDFLGILFSINMLKVLRLPSLKICTLLLSALFIYDIFFVFITPLITKNGKSIMVEVATGGDSGEQVPMVLRVPHLSCNDMKTCAIPYSMLGFGDILVPGLLLSYCHSFDLFVGTPCKLYWLISNISYILGLGATFVSLYLMESAQPALLFLVPFTLIPIMIAALIRGEFGKMWQGDFDAAPSSLSGSTNHVDTRRDSTGQDAESVPAKEGVPVDGEIPE